MTPKKSNIIYISAPVLNKYIKNFGLVNGSVQTIWSRARDANGEPISTDIKGSYKVDIFKAHLNKLADKYLGKNADKEIDKRDKKYKDIIEEYRSYGFNTFNDVFAVTYHNLCQTYV